MTLVTGIRKGSKNAPTVSLDSFSSDGTSNRSQPVKRDPMRRGKDSQFLLVLLLAAFVFSTSGCRILKIDQTFRGDSHVWITEGGTNTRSNATVLAVNPPLKQVWSYNALAAFGPGPPLVADGIVFVANRQGELHAIDLQSGKRRGTASFGKAIEGTPVIADGVVYVSVAWKGKAVQAYD